MVHPARRVSAEPIVSAVQRHLERYDAAIVGGGIIGLASAWRAAQRGLSVCVLERESAGCGATRAAAGVLAPDPETPGFTARYGVHLLVWCEDFPTADEAITAEKRIKRWRRAWKLSLIERDNPRWDDLYLTLTG